jgi:hypothetical protein
MVIIWAMSVILFPMEAHWVADSKTDSYLPDDGPQDHSQA